MEDKIIREESRNQFDLKMYDIVMKKTFVDVDAIADKYHITIKDGWFEYKELEDGYYYTYFRGIAKNHKIWQLLYSDKKEKESDLIAIIDALIFKTGFKAGMVSLKSAAINQCMRKAGLDLLNIIVELYYYPEEEDEFYIKHTKELNEYKEELNNLQSELLSDKKRIEEEQDKEEKDWLIEQAEYTKKSIVFCKDMIDTTQQMIESTYTFNIQQARRFFEESDDDAGRKAIVFFKKEIEHCEFSKAKYKRDCFQLIDSFIEKAPSKQNRCAFIYDVMSGLEIIGNEYNLTARQKYHCLKEFLKYNDEATNEK